ncbi:hypothetical protein, partial [Thiolapillus sp.]|uniref:hypothetical protein n=1 Tax=Thiolapillus sp. TaxID=2017437 RepID=UPI003AF6E4DA
MALCFLQVLREPVVQYLAGSEQRIAPFWNIITWYPTPQDKGVVVRNNDHYRDKAARVADLEVVIGQQVGQATGTRL